VDFENKVVLITGGATGIGSAAALEFARRGAQVAVADKNEDVGEATVAEVRSNGGSIVNTASIAAMTAAPKMSSYAASKHGVIGLTKTAAVEYASEGIRINAVCPGVIDTDMTKRAIEKGGAGTEKYLPGIHPMDRIGTAEEVVAAMLWLSSDASSFTTGAILPVEGGRLAR